jgi:hypothetical protein
MIIIIQTYKELNIGKSGESTWKLVDHVIVFHVGRWHNEGRMNVTVSVEHRRRNDFVELVVVEGAVDGVAQVDFAGHQDRRDEKKDGREAVVKFEDLHMFKTKLKFG